MSKSKAHHHPLYNKQSNRDKLKTPVLVAMGVNLLADSHNTFAAMNIMENIMLTNARSPEMTQVHTPLLPKKHKSNSILWPKGWTKLLDITAIHYRITSIGLVEILYHVYMR